MTSRSSPFDDDNDVIHFHPLKTLRHLYGDQGAAYYIVQAGFLSKNAIAQIAKDFVYNCPKNLIHNCRKILLKHTSSNDSSDRFNRRRS